MAEALAAVTEPSLAKAGRIPLMESAVIPSRMVSSSVKSKGSPLLRLDRHGELLGVEAAGAGAPRRPGGGSRRRRRPGRPGRRRGRSRPSPRSCPCGSRCRCPRARRGPWSPRPRCGRAACRGRASGEQVGRVGHGLHPAGDEAVGVPRADRLGGEHHGLEPGAADLVDGHAPHLVGDAGAPGRLAGGVLTRGRPGGRCP